MTVDTLLRDLFPAGHNVISSNGLLLGFGTTAQGDIAVLGTTDHLALDSTAALDLAAFVLKIVRENTGCPILMLVDTQGQRLSKTEELLGINGYLAHLVELAGTRDVDYLIHIAKPPLGSSSPPCAPDKGLPAMPPRY